MDRRKQRATCPKCQRSVGVLLGGTLVPHLSNFVPGTPSTPRCPGGEMPPIDGLIREVVEKAPAPRAIPADRTVSSVHAWRGGLPGLRR